MGKLKDKIHAFFGLAEVTVAVDLFANASIETKVKRFGCEYNQFSITGGGKLGLSVATFSKGCTFGGIEGNIYAGARTGGEVAATVQGSLYTLQEKTANSCTEGEFCVNVSGKLFFEVGAVAALDLSIFDVSVGATLGVSIMAEGKSCYTCHKGSCKWNDFSVYISGGIDASFYALTKSFNSIDFGKTKVL